MDRNLETRTAAEQLLRPVATNVGYEQLMKSFTDLKPAEQQSLKGLLDKYRDVHVTSSAPPSTREAAYSCRADVAAPEIVGIHSAAPTPPLTPTTRAVAEEYIPPRTIPVPPQVSQAPPQVVQNVPPPQMVAPTTPAPTTVVPGHAPSFRESMQLIKAGSLEQAIYQCTEWTRHLRDPSPVPCLNTSQDIFTLAQVLLDRLRNVVEAPTYQQMAAEKVVGTLQALMDRKELVTMLGSNHLVDIIGSVLERLLDERLHSEVNLIRALNALMLKLLENSDMSTCLEALMTRLSAVTRSYLIAPSKMNHKYMELTIKCILKMSKRMASTLVTSDIDRLLISINAFLKAHPPTSFKDRDDLPLRTVKTLLHEIVKATGVAARAACSRLFSDSGLVGNFVEMCISKQESTKEANAALKESTTQSAVQTRAHHMDPAASYHAHDHAPPPLSAVTPNVPRPSTGEFDDQIMTIFTKIRKLNQTEQGLLELYNVMRTHPDVDISLHYNRCSDAFQTYIFRRLGKFLEEDINNKVLPPTFVLRVPKPREQTVKR
jgi:cytoskeleton-associated protein 5